MVKEEVKKWRMLTKGQRRFIYVHSRRHPSKYVLPVDNASHYGYSSGSRPAEMLDETHVHQDEHEAAWEPRLGHLYAFTYFTNPLSRDS